MNGGKIFGNKTSSEYSSGGGVYVYPFGTFTMNNGEIFGNTAGRYGGGVCLNDDSSFAKTGGTIYGYDESDLEHSNKVKTTNIVSNKGHAVYRNDMFRKEDTVGLNDKMYYNYPGEADKGWD
jgi:hypothetical protein